MTALSTARALLFFSVASSIWASGTTICLALGALWGMYLSLRHGVPGALRLPLIWLMALFALVLGVDVANGGGMANIDTTAMGFLPFVLAPFFAVALHRADLSLEDAVLPVLGGLVVVALGGIALSFRHIWGFAHGIGYGPLGFGFVVSLWLLFALSVATAGRRWRGLAAVVAVLGVAALVVAQSKAVLIAVTAGAIVAMLTGGGLPRSGPVRAALLGALASGVVGAWVVMGDELRQGWEVFSGLLAGREVFDTSILPRVEMIVAGWHAFLDRPILGHGLAEHLKAALVHQRDWGWSFEHNTSLHIEYLVHLVSYGVMGLVFLGAFLWLLCWLALGQRHGAARGWAWGVATLYAVFMLFDHTLNFGPLTGPGAVTLAMLMALRARPETPA